MNFEDGEKGEEEEIQRGIGGKVGGEERDWLASANAPTNAEDKKVTGKAQTHLERPVVAERLDLGISSGFIPILGINFRFFWEFVPYVTRPDCWQQVF